MDAATHKSLNDDIIDVSDTLGPKGFVVITDTRTGKILLKKHNMILKDGKNFLLYLLLGKMTGGDSANDAELSKLTNYQLTALCLGTDTDETYFNMDRPSNYKVAGIHSLSSSNIEYTIGEVTNSDTSANDSLKFLVGHHYIKFNIKVSGDSSTDYISEISLVLTPNTQQGEEDNNKLFSRIVFDPIPFGADTIFELDYYLYF